MFLDNLLINTNVIDAARQLGVHKVVVMGSVSIYADGLVQPVREEDIWHGPPHRSEAGYAHAKRAMLAQLEMYRDQYGMDYACAISTNLFGPNDRFDELNGHVVPSLISKFHRAVRSEGTVVAWGSGTPTRDFLYSEDAAAALVILLARGHGAYNLASGTHVTIRTLVETIATVSGYDGDITWDPSKPDGQSSRSFNIERLTDLGWRPDTSLEEALRQTFDWYATNASTARH
jgi:GDP-L-fucose synthase